MRRTHPEDSFEREYLMNFHSAGGTLLLAFGLFVLWIAVNWIDWPRSAVLAAGVATVFGWGAMTAAAISGLQFVYAFVGSPGTELEFAL